MHKVYVTTNFCSCRLCRGANNVTTPLDLEAAKAAQAGTHRVQVVGARNPRLITYPATWELIPVSANRNLAWNPAPGMVPVASGSDSVHGCSKVRENQWTVLYVPVRDTEDGLEIVATRPAGGSLLFDLLPVGEVEHA